MPLLLRRKKLALNAQPVPHLIAKLLKSSILLSEITMAWIEFEQMKTKNFDLIDKQRS
jgi:hypothetical protein